MFNLSFIEHPNTRFNHYVISNNTGTKAVIYPELGASLQQLYVNTKPVINNIIGTTNEPQLLNSSCSAVLFPFANRINRGQYEYQGEQYQLECNETARGHAMHGLIYQQCFDFLDAEVNEEGANISFVYHQDHRAVGFPFPFKTVLTYRLTGDSLRLEVDVENTGTRSFPFSLGWHPYFYSRDLDRSTIHMNSQQQIQTDETMIPIGINTASFPNPLLLEQEQFDTGFILEAPEIHYKTPDYQIRIYIEQDMTQPYVQLYTPAHRQSIAIEPMTAATDCYNNNWGTRELLPQETYRATWQIEANTTAL
ncbi:MULTISPECIES: aldose 1-epimerase [unclassified Aureispira]|uniref:aldose 1-epimerase n=1 Tax=unclassified Aureispira TaxID=2649989 RepID=UPI0006979C84|nr:MULTISPECIES: aldose 1-epimerase [unclassified Aureispira]WMX15076.1 aldose 1-epimerase [Aureispira sp. CCB-E]